MYEKHKWPKNMVIAVKTPKTHLANVANLPNRNRRKRQTYPHAIYGSTILSMLIEALLSLTKVPLKIWRRRRSCSTFRTFGLTPLILQWKKTPKFTWHFIRIIINRTGKVYNFGQYKFDPSRQKSFRVTMTTSVFPHFGKFFYHCSQFASFSK